MDVAAAKKSPPMEGMKEPPCWRIGADGRCRASCPATGTRPCAPAALWPSTEKVSVQAQQQAEQQRAERQRHPQRLEAAQFGVGVAFGSIVAGHGGIPADVGCISGPGAAVRATGQGPLAAGLWQNRGSRGVRLAPSART